MRRILFLLAVLLAMCDMTKAHDVCIDGIFYDLIPKANIAFVVKGTNDYSGDIVIPSTISYKDGTYSVTEIEEMAFFCCRGLTSITIPNSVTSIGNEAFSNCKKLKIVTLGSGIHTIDSCAFEKCQNLELVYCHATIPPSCDISSFKDSYIEYSKLFVPKESIAAYKNADGWKDFGTIKALEKKDGTKP